MRRLLALLTALALLTVVACGGDDGDGESADQPSSSSRSDVEDDGEDEDDEDDGTISDGSSTSTSATSATRATSPRRRPTRRYIEEIQGFWEERAERIGVDYEPLTDDRLGAPQEEEVICYGEPLPEDFALNNAVAVGCPEGTAVVWDPVWIDEFLVGIGGPAAPPAVLAHEFGHVLQYQFGAVNPDGTINEDSVLIETQADCFAGAFVDQATEDGYGPFADPMSLESSLAISLEIADPVGNDPNAEGAHGSGFDRVRSFQDGYEGGVEYCYGYLEDPPFIFELPFTEEEFENQGNLPFDEVTDLVVEDLDDYFQDEVEGFDGPSDPFDVIPEDELEALHAQVGDGAVATVFGMLWAERAQEAADEDVDGEGPLLQRACLLGSWLGDIIRDQRDGEVERESGVSLSPGDLDETIQTFLNLSAEAMSTPGVAFEAIADMRLGVFGGFEDCRLGE